jgi:ubiquinone/menaquinone biosynthesis C-methylase UbiE
MTSITDLVEGVMAKVSIAAANIVAPSTRSVPVATKSQSRGGVVTTSAIVLGTTLSAAALYKMSGFSAKKGIARLTGGIYDKMIVSMTEVWYKNVLERQADNAIILDVGIGTAGALLQCKDIIKAKNLTIIGIDYNEFYIEAASEQITKHGMEDFITVHALSIYDDKKLQNILDEYIKSKEKRVDSVYFSGSFSLLPDPKAALIAVMRDALKPDSGKIYITQTYQKKTPPLMSHVKPLIKYITTIDFGQLVKTEEVVELLKSDDLVKEGLVLEEHKLIEGSLDNYWQAAYVSVMGQDSKTSPTKGFFSKVFQ